MFGILRRATTVVVYTAIPVAGPIKSMTVSTRASSQRSKKGLRELQKQTKLMQQSQQQMLHSTAPQPTFAQPTALGTCGALHPDGATCGMAPQAVLGFIEDPSLKSTMDNIGVVSEPTVVIGEILAAQPA